MDTDADADFTNYVVQITHINDIVLGHLYYVVANYAAGVERGIGIVTKIRRERKIDCIELLITTEHGPAEIDVLFNGNCNWRMIDVITPVSIYAQESDSAPVLK